MPGHVGLMALGQPWMNEGHYADLVTGCCLTMDLSEANSEIHQLARQGYDMLVARSTEFDAMKQIIGTVIQWLATQPNTKIHRAAVKRLRDFDEQRRVSGDSQGSYLPPATNDSRET